jgi:periplasmic divalent cation tolerance protein
MTDVVLVLTTVPVDDRGDNLATALVAERLAACVNIGTPMTSVYWWRGVLTHDTERQLVIKTTVDRVAAVKARLIEQHAYELPEILVLAVAEGSEPYLDWIRNETTAAPDE